VNIRRRSFALRRLAASLRQKIDLARQRKAPTASIRQRLRHVEALLADLDARAG
jgi:hypothetical protein